jgi:2-isopropylmalate synthase
MEQKLCMSEDDVLECIRLSVMYARRFVAEVEWTPEIASRSDPVFLERAIHVAVKAGARIINVADTTGYMLPHEYAALIARVVAIVSAYDGVVVSAHCHDDLGCAVANSLVALHAGARQVECTVNGIGERAGNAALEEVVVAMTVRKEMLKLAHTVRTERLAELSVLVAEASHTPVAYNKAIVGRNAFSHESGIHQDGILKSPSLYEEINPSLVGRTRSLTLGKLSGVAALRHAILELGFSPSEFDEEMLRTRFKAFADECGSVDASLFARFVAELRGSEK